MKFFAIANETQSKLEAAGLDPFEARSVTRVLLAHVAGVEPGRLFAAEWSPEAAERLHPLVERVLAGEPVQYVTGTAPFYGRDFRVSPAVLIPRFDSECLVERALALLRGKGAPLIGDICCGSGCLGLSLGAELPESRVWLTDLSPSALAVAGENAEALGLADRCRFFQGNLAAPLLEAGEKLDLIVCNPPYVSRMDLAAVSAQVRREPALALDGGAGGLSLYPELLAQCRALLAPGGWLVLEHGDDQQEQVWQLCLEKGLSPRERLRDLGGRPRAVAATV